MSRTLVLLDGVPFNDPFGGWVYWTRVPLDATDRIEVVDGSSSSLYGNYAMGGVINVMTTAAMRRTVDVKAQHGNHSSPKVDFRASDVWGKVGVVFDGGAVRPTAIPSSMSTRRASRNAASWTRTRPNRTFNLKAATRRPTTSVPSSAAGTSVKSGSTARPARSTAPTSRTTRAGRR